MFPMKTAQKFAANFISNAASDRHFYFQLTLNCACRGGRGGKACTKNPEIFGC